MSVDVRGSGRYPAEVSTPTVAARSTAGRKPTGDAALVKVTVALPSDVVEALGPNLRAEIRAILVDHVRRRTSDGQIRDPESTGA